MSTKLKLNKRGTEARNELIAGANYLADCVKATLGPYGQNWLLEKGNRVTNDGVTIANNIEIKDEIQNRGAFILREAAKKTNDEAGDGTTTAITLAQAILKEAVRHLGNEEKGIMAKMTPAEVIRQLESERKIVTEKLIAISKPIDSVEDLINSASVSVEDEELGKLIGTAQWDLGPDGVLIAEETNDRACSIEKVTGIKTDTGLGTNAIMNNEEKQSLEIEESAIILSNFTFHSGIVPVMKILNALINAKVKNCVLIGRAFSAEAIRDCMANIKNGFNLYAINAPYTDQKEIMLDMAAVLGGTYFDVEERDMEDMLISDVGHLSKLVAYRYSSIFTGKNDERTQARIKGRVDELKKKLAGAESEFEKKNLRVRIAQLENGFAIVKVGANTEAERGYKKDKCDDAVNAVRAAFQEGVVPGAGLAFKTISEGLADTFLLKRPLLAINEQIMSTAPKDFVIESWVMDPVKVLRIALEKACGVAGVLAGAAGATATERDAVRYVAEAKQE